MVHQEFVEDGLLVSERLPELEDKVDQLQLTMLLNKRESDLKFELYQTGFHL